MAWLKPQVETAVGVELVPRASDSQQHPVPYQKYTSLNDCK